MRTSTTIIGLSLLATAAGVSFILPGELVLSPRTGLAASSPDVIRLNGVVRDFRPTHSDFDASLSDANGHIVDLMAAELGENGLPAYDGSGNRIVKQATDASGKNIAPIMALGGYTQGVDFVISKGQVIASEEFAALVSILGAAIEDIPVTAQVKIGTSTYQPWGSFNSPNTANLNDNKNPRHYVAPSIYPAGTVVAVTGQSWSSSTKKLLTADSNINSKQVKVLRNGDVVPNIKPAGSQAPIESYLAGYIDVAKKKVTIADNQVIYLFELYVTDLSSEYADFQDLVVLLTMAKKPDAFVPGAIPPVKGCGPDTDSVAKFDASPNNGAITSADTFKQWFTDTLGSNLSATMPIDLVNQGDGTYLFDDKTDSYYSKLGGFYPADNRLYGDKDASGHNSQFTFQLDAKFTYDESSPQFFSTATDTEVWVFIDGKLVIDLGGFHGVTQQRIDLSRLCLEDGKEYEMQIFMANRYAPMSSLRMHTNIEFMGAAPEHSVAAAHD